MSKSEAQKKRKLLEREVKADNKAMLKIEIQRNRLRESNVKLAERELLVQEKDSARQAKKREDELKEQMKRASEQERRAREQERLAELQEKQRAEKLSQLEQRNRPTVQIQQRAGIPQHVYGVEEY